MTVQPRIVHTIPSLTLFGEEYTDVAVEVSAYMTNDVMAVQLLCAPDEEWAANGGYREPLCRVSLNVPGQRPAEGCFWVGLYSEHEEVTRSLVAAGIIALTGTETTTGPFGSRVAEARLLVGA